MTRSDTKDERFNPLWRFHFPIDWNLVLSTLFSLLLHGAFLAFVLLVAPAATDAFIPGFDNDRYFARYQIGAKDHPIRERIAQTPNHRFKEGASGHRRAKKNANRFGIHGPNIWNHPPEMARSRARQMPRKSGYSAEPHVEMPTFPFGLDEPIGYDPKRASGRLRGAVIGPNFGYCGLGFKNIGRGGGKTKQSARIAPSNLPRQSQPTHIDPATDGTGNLDLGIPSRNPTGRDTPGPSTVLERSFRHPNSNPGRVDVAIRLHANIGTGLLAELQIPVASSGFFFRADGLAVSRYSDASHRLDRYILGEAGYSASTASVSLGAGATAGSSNPFLISQTLRLGHRHRVNIRVKNRIALAPTASKSLNQTHTEARLILPTGPGTSLMIEGGGGRSSYLFGQAGLTTRIGPRTRKISASVTLAAGLFRHENTDPTPLASIGLGFTN